MSGSEQADQSTSNNDDWDSIVEGLMADGLDFAGVTDDSAGSHVPVIYNGSTGSVVAVEIAGPYAVSSALRIRHDGDRLVSSDLEDQVTTLALEELESTGSVDVSDITQAIFEVYQDLIVELEETSESDSIGEMWSTFDTMMRRRIGLVAINELVIERAVTDPDPTVRWFAALNSDTTPEQLDRLLRDGIGQVARAVGSNPTIDRQHVVTALRTSDDKLLLAAMISSPLCLAAEAAGFLGSDSVELRRAAARNPNLSIEHLALALADEDEEVRTIVLASPRMSPAQLIAAYATETSAAVVSTIVLHQNAPAEVLEMAVRHPDRTVRGRLAAQGIALTPEMLEVLLNDEDPAVRGAAAINANCELDQLDQALAEEVVSPGDLLKNPRLTRLEITAVLAGWMPSVASFVTVDLCDALPPAWSLAALSIIERYSVAAEDAFQRRSD